MTSSITPDGRTAAGAEHGADQAVTLINSFIVPDGSDATFVELWTQTSHYFRAQPGFRSLRLHRAVTPDARYRYVNVARWATDVEYRAPHQADEFRRLVNQPAWHQFPSSPALYTVQCSVGDDPGTPV